MLIVRLIPIAGILAVAGIAVGVQAQSGDRIEEGSAPYAVAQALTEEEAAAGMPLQVQYFATFDEAMRSIHVDPADFSADSAAPSSSAESATSADGSADSPSAKAPEKHCVVRIEPLQPGGEASAMSAATCFDRFSDAIYAATGGAVRLAPTVAPADVTEETFEPLSHQTVISIDYRDSNFSGSTLTWVVNNSYGCTTGISYAAPSMPSGWNDVVSSARTFAGCTYNRHYEHTNYGGSKIDCYCATMGAMNDKTSSEKWNRVQPTP